MNSIYSIFHFNFFDKIVEKKRSEMTNIINSYLNNIPIKDALDIGTTNNLDYKSNNFIIKNIKNVQSFKSISDQKINDIFFSKCLTKSITDDFNEEEVTNFRSDLVISNATIEHVGKFENQIKMMKNIIKLTSKNFVISAPNRYHPVEFHTKLLFLHWLPNRIHRKLFNILGFKFFAKEENLNLLSKNDLKSLLEICGIEKYKIFNIRLLGFKSNFMTIGEVN